MRIIAGHMRGTRLVAPAGDRTRPTLDRVRESLFMILHDRIPDTRVLDLFAGAGTLGLEAVSRGAREALLVDHGRAAFTALKSNISKLRCRDRATAARQDVFRFLSQPEAVRRPFDLIFVDPPYGAGLAAKTAARIADAAELWLAPGGLMILQCGRRDPIPDEFPPLVRSSDRDYGETRIIMFASSDADGSRGEDQETHSEADEQRAGDEIHAAQETGSDAPPGETEQSAEEDHPAERPARDADHFGP